MAGVAEPTEARYSAGRQVARPALRARCLARIPRSRAAMTLIAPVSRPVRHPVHDSPRRPPDVNWRSLHSVATQRSRGTRYPIWQHVPVDRHAVRGAPERPRRSPGCPARPPAGRGYPGGRFRGHPGGTRRSAFPPDRRAPWCSPGLTPDLHVGYHVRRPGHYSAPQTSRTDSTTGLTGRGSGPVTGIWTRPVISANVDSRPSAGPFGPAARGVRKGGGRWPAACM